MPKKIEVIFWGPPVTPITPRIVEVKASSVPMPRINAIINRGA